MTPPEPAPGGVPSGAAAGGSPEAARSRSQRRRQTWTELDQSSIMTVELIAGILTWGGLGLLADRWLGTAPWLMGAGVFIGFGAGLYLVWLRSSTQEGTPDRPSEEAQQPARQTDGSSHRVPDA